MSYFGHDSRPTYRSAGHLQSSDGIVDRPVSSHKLVAAVRITPVVTTLLATMSRGQELSHSELQSHKDSSDSFWATISRAQQWLTLSYNLTRTAATHSELQSHECNSGSIWFTISWEQQLHTLSYNFTSVLFICRVTGTKLVYAAHLDISFNMCLHMDTYVYVNK